MKALQDLVELSKVPYNNAIKDWKEKNNKVIGFFCSYIPEEILCAADILPYRVRPTGCTETASADVYMAPVNCTFVRCCLEFAIKGVYGFLDGLVSMNSCDHIRRLYDICRYKAKYPYMHFLSVPHKISDEAIQWYKDEIDNFKESLETSFGIKITEEKLSDAIKLHNETRNLLKRLYDLREREDVPIKGSDVLSITLAASAAPKERFNGLVRKLLEELGGVQGLSGYRARLMVVGSACDDPAFIEVVEDLGGLVVADSLCFGSRYFEQPVEVNGELSLALAKSYLNRPSCARMSGGEPERWEFIKQMVERLKVDGIIYQRLRSCDLWGGELLYLRKKLKESEIPLLELEREYWLTGVGQLKTRVEAFLELIGR